MTDSARNPLQDLREQTRKGLQFLISYMLSNAEQTLLGMAGKARGTIEQAQNHEAVRELRLKGSALERVFLARAIAGFDQAGQPAAAPAPRAPAPSLPPGGELRIGGLGVVKDNILEEQLALDNIASRARHEHRDALVRLARNLARESGRRRVDLDSLPIGPQALAHAFMDACTELEIDPKARIVFSRLFTRFVIDELGPFYAECVALFPEETSAPAVPDGPALRSATDPVELPTGKTEPADAESAVAPGASPVDIVWDSQRTPLLAPPGKAMAMPRNLVDEVLKSLQERLLDSSTPLAALNPRAGIQPLDVIQLLNDTLAEMGHTRAMALPADVLESVSLIRLLLEHTLRNPQVPGPVRRLQRLLQIPLIRAALRDADVLHSAEHPARALLRELGAAAGGEGSAAGSADDDFLRLAKLLVTRILNDYDKDVSVFRASLDDLRRYLRAQDGSASQEAAAGPGTRGPAPPVAAAAPTAPPTPATRAPARAEASPEFVQLVDKMAPDAWVELKEAGGVRRRVKLLSRIPRTGQLHFVDEQGNKAAEFNRIELAAMIENGDAKILHGAGGGAPAPGRFGRR